MMKMNMITDYAMTERVRSARTFRTPKNFWLQGLIFCGVFFAANILQSVILMIDLTPQLYAWVNEVVMTTGAAPTTDEIMDFMNNLMMNPSNTLLMLFSTVVVTIIALIFCRYIEGRRLETMGFLKKGALLQYLIGLGVGFVMFSGVVLLAYAFGGLTAEGLAGGTATGILLAFLGFFVQGMSEEVLCRGYFMTTVLRHHGPWVAVLSNSLIFAFLHISNPGVSLLALVNLTLCGIMFSLYVLRTDNLWGACAIHTVWNFVQGNFYGLPVSGVDSGDSVFAFSLKEGMDIVNGGAFGAEGGIPTTIVLCAAIAVLLFVPFGKKPEKKEVASV